VWRAAWLLGGTLAAVCKKAGAGEPSAGWPDAFEALLRCLLPSADRAELYPGDRADTIDFTLPGHTARLGEGGYELEGIYGNRYRSMGARASARLESMRPGPRRRRVRGFAHQTSLHQGRPLDVELWVNGRQVARETLDRPGFFVNRG
jgi:hypothetical protein